MQGLAGRVALVTGAGRGIGRAICMAYGAAGAKVAAAARSTEELDSVVDEIRAAGGTGRQNGMMIFAMMNVHPPKRYSPRRAAPQIQPG